MRTQFPVILTAVGVIVACSATSNEDSAHTMSQAANGCVDGVPEYIDHTTGEMVICVYTEEPGPSEPEPPIDPCFYFPELCYPPEPPEPTDPCLIDPSSCGGGPEPGPAVCDANEDIPANFQQEVDARVESCFQKDWSGVTFHEQTDSVNYSPGSGPWYYSIGDWLTNNVTSCVVQNIDWVFYSNSVGGQIMQGLVNRLNQQASAQNLSPHQKICSAMCVSGRLIKYSMDNMLNVLPSSAVTDGMGVCRDFAQIGERLLDGMGFQSSVVGSMATQHAFVEVTSPEGGSFYVEPQPSKCVFYNRH